MGLGFEKIKENKALHAIIKRIQADANNKQRLFGNKYLYFNINGLENFSKDIIKLCEFTYFTCIENEDVVNARKTLTSKLKTFKMSYEDFYITKFKLSNVLLTASTSEELLLISDEDMLTLSLFYRTICIVEILLCKTSKRIITGVDVQNNKLRYISCDDLYFDRINTRFVTENHVNIYMKEFERMIESLHNEFPDLSQIELLSRANDKVDEVLASYSETKIMLNLLGVKGNVNLDKRLECLKTLVCAKTDKRCWDNKKLVCEESLVLKFTEGVKLIKIQDYNISNNYPCVIVNYVDEEGREDTSIIPTSMAVVVYTTNVDIIEKVSDFYCKSESKDCKAYNEDIWQDRFSSDIESKLRNYKVQAIPICMHTAKMGNPSKEALELAEKWNIKLEPGETLVKGHIRRYGKSKEN